MEAVVIIISLIISNIIVKWFRGVFMKMIGADFMFFSKKKHLIAVIILTIVIAGLIMRIITGE